MVLTIALVLAAALGVAFAQDAPADAPGADPSAAGAVRAPEGAPSGPVGLQGEDPEALADAAVEAWLASEARTLADLSTQDAETVCRELPGLFAAPPPPEGTEVDVTDRRERDAGAEDRRRYTYAAEIPPDRLDVVEVILVRSDASADGGAADATAADATAADAGAADAGGAADAPAAVTWTVDRVGFQLPESTGRSWLQSRQAGLGFLLVTVLFVLSLLRPSPMRRWLAAGRDAVAEHRRLVLVTMAAGWAIVGLGLWSGAQLPDACEEAVLTILGATLDQVGANQALASGELARTALVIFYQNFVVVTMTALFGSALLLGVPAYLLAGVSFLAQSTAFGVLGLGGFPEILLVAVLFVLEFTSYFLVVAGGGMLVATLARGGFSEIGSGYRKLIATLPWAALLLLIGAWYEAAILLL